MNKKLITSSLLVLVLIVVALLGLYLIGGGNEVLTMIFSTNNDGGDKNLETHTDRVPEHISIPRMFFDETGKPITNDSGNPLNISLPAIKN